MTTAVKAPAKNWWVMTESNRRHSACKADALPTELITRIGKGSIKPKNLFECKRFLHWRQKKVILMGSGGAWKCNLRPKNTKICK